MSSESDVDVDAEMIAEFIGQIHVGTFSGDPDWNAEIWIGEFAEPVLGTEIFDQLEGRPGTLPGVDRIAREDREFFLARLARGIDSGGLNDRVVEVVRAANREAGHALP